LASHRLIGVGTSLGSLDFGIVIIGDIVLVFAVIESREAAPQKHMLGRFRQASI
jgi:hypothetical protein